MKASIYWYSKYKTKDYRVISADTSREMEQAVNSAAEEGFVVTNSFAKVVPTNRSYPLQFVAYMERTL